MIYRQSCFDAARILDPRDMILLDIETTGLDR